MKKVLCWYQNGRDISKEELSSLYAMKHVVSISYKSWTQFYMKLFNIAYECVIFYAYGGDDNEKEVWPIYWLKSCKSQE